MGARSGISLLEEDYMHPKYMTSVKRLATDVLECYIELRYEGGATQDELDILETIFARRVTEEDPAMTEEDIRMSEEQFNGASFEEGLFDLYRRYIQPKGRRDGLMGDTDIISGLRTWAQEAAFCLGGLKENVTDKQILEAAQDVYERKIDLIRRYRRHRNHIRRGR
jgi:hypothetical protein